MYLPIRAATVLFGLIVLTSPPVLAQTQEEGRVSDVALGMPGLRHGDDSDQKDHKARAKAAHRPAPSTKVGKSRKVDKRPKIAVTKSTTMVPRSTFEDRTAHYFDPLSLTVTPDTTLEPVTPQYTPVEGSFTSAGRGSPLLVIPEDPNSENRISSAGIENMGKGNNHTIVVPLFQLLNKLSDQPAVE